MVSVYLVSQWVGVLIEEGTHTFSNIFTPNSKFVISVMVFSVRNNACPLVQVNNPLAVIRRTSGNLQQYFIVHYHFIIMQS